MTTSDFIPFANNLTNVLDLTDYDTLAPAGNVTGIASSAFANRALRQGSTIAALIANLMLNVTSSNVSDTYNMSDTTIPATLYGQLAATLGVLPPYVLNLLSGTSATYAPPVYFFCSSFTVTPLATATYTNNGVTFTVLSTSTIAGVPVILAQASSSIGAPVASGTLTKASGTGDSTVTFYAYRAPIALDIDMKGGGGAGGGVSSGTSADSGVGTGGGEGGRILTTINSPSLSGFSYTVGASVAGSTTSGTAGNNTVFGSFTADGGAGGNHDVDVASAPNIVSNVLATGGIAAMTATAIGFRGIPGGFGIWTVAISQGGLGGGVGGGVGGSAGAGGGFSGDNGTTNTGGGGGGGAVNAYSGTAAGGGGAAGYIYVKAVFQ